MHPQLAVIAAELADTGARATELVQGLDETAFHARPDPPGWSVAECVAHLNLMDEAMLPRIDAAILEAQTAGTDPARRYRRDVVGWLLSYSLDPPSRVRTRTTPPFVPASTGSRETVLSRFMDLRVDLGHRLEAASGLDLNRVRVRSPINAKLSYNLYSAFRVIAAHERRHLWQAEQVRARLGPATGS
ncbi:MAG TPA: DinB family protein [Gemmatimonadales bacterium]|nr:DinB family protein [Gemmatimonadales bacterium]